MPGARSTYFGVDFVAGGEILSQLLGRERTLDRIARSQMAPMLRRKIVERQQLLLIFQRAFHGLGEFGLIRLDQQIERFEGLFTFCQPSVIR